MALFTKGSSNAKLRKSELSGKGFASLILHLAPAKESGYEVCASRSDGCTEACLNTAGRGNMVMVQNARILKTIKWFEDRDVFKSQASAELTAFVKQCAKRNVLPAVRMNGTSDIVWEKLWPELFTDFSGIQFYDYTKHVKRCVKPYKLPENYHLTFSRSEDNDKDVMKVLKFGRHNVAVVFNGKNYPPEWRGFKTYSADDDDLRFLDPAGGQVGCLYAKGRGKRDKKGFVLPVI